MKSSIAMISAVAGGLLVIVAGCGKTESSAPPTTQADKPASPPQAQATPVAEKALAQATNAVVTATNAVPATADSATKAADAALPQAQPAVARSAAATNQASTSILADSAKAGLAGLSQDQMTQGLMAALGKGVQQAVAGLGHDGGFLTNLNVKIPMPEKLQKVEAAVRAMKQDKLADDFIATMNHAAEQAVPEAGTVFADALKQMTIEDAKSILCGPNDAATQYFQKTTQTNLYARFYPIVQKATGKTGVTAAYKNFMEKADVTSSLGKFGGSLGGSLLSKDAMDVDAYVTNKALDGLFKMVAEEEKRIRQNPVARTTDVLQKVFGALKP